MADEDPRILSKFIKDMYKVFEFDPRTAKEYAEVEAELMRDLHAKFVRKGFHQLPKGMTGLDSGQPWFLFWLTNALEIMNVEGYSLTEEEKSRCCAYLRQCWNKEEGGFGGAPYHMSHIASNYAAMLAIVNIGTLEAYEIVDVQLMKKFLLSVKNNHTPAHQIGGNVWEFMDQEGKLVAPTGCSKVNASLPGSVQIHQNGEIDMRGVYCSLVVADILGILDSTPELTQGMGDFIKSCQTHEGGITCIPHGEAHGGYTFCGLASLILLKESNKLNLDRLLEWLCNRQMMDEGGFNGRINKLVDSCYNFWQGASFELFDIALKGKGNVEGQYLFNQEALQGYTVICCQEGKGGLKDKPMKNPDYYHTAYASSGMSISQHKANYEKLHSPDAQTESFDGASASLDELVLLSGLEKNKLRRIHPVFNVRYDFVERAKAFYRDQQ